jgi:hypothetical protein
MNQAPSRHPRRIVFARPLIGADGNALKQTEDRAGGLIKLRVFRPLDQNGSEHQAKETTLLQGELDIGETNCAEGIALGRPYLHRCDELSKAFRGDRRKEILLVGKMAIRGCRGHSDAAGRLPQANDVWAGFIQDGPALRRVARLGDCYDNRDVAASPLDFSYPNPLAEKSLRRFVPFEFFRQEHLRPGKRPFTVWKTAVLRLSWSPSRMNAGVSQWIQCRREASRHRGSRWMNGGRPWPPDRALRTTACSSSWPPIAAAEAGRSTISTFSTPPPPAP